MNTLDNPCWALCSRPEMHGDLVERQITMEESLLVAFRCFSFYFNSR